MLNTHATMRNYLILGFLCFSQLLSTRLLMRLCDLYAFKREADKAQVL